MCGGAACEATKFAKLKLCLKAAAITLSSSGVATEGFLNHNYTKRDLSNGIHHASLFKPVVDKILGVPMVGSVWDNIKDPIKNLDDRVEAENKLIKKNRARRN